MMKMLRIDIMTPVTIVHYRLDHMFLLLVKMLSDVKDLGRKYTFSAQSLSVSGSFFINLIEKMLHSP